MSYDDLIEESKITLRRLLLNLKMNDYIVVKQIDNNLIKAGSVSSIEEEKPEWLDLNVYDISVKNNKLQIKISSL